MHIMAREMCVMQTTIDAVLSLVDLQRERINHYTV